MTISWFGSFFSFPYPYVFVLEYDSVYIVLPFCWKHEMSFSILNGSQIRVGESQNNLDFEVLAMMESLRYQELMGKS